ncbi:Uma2 family endonuclease [Kovacikia minuta CCNUW1]|uniref:Uma2 family endonuclease n=1 Tax=Kovacikia minuta TaxID=2931930 RepID=UPI001CCF70CF|nr:Uma2 family endonuclease [Kovacikia minuta]UBF27343.1 Uma2 family endonuclease [Kovacikia minuta CCNUW1]
MLEPAFNELDIPLPPTQDELPCDDGIPMETYRHKLQMDLLVDSLNTWLVLEQGSGFVGGNMFVYFSPLQVKNHDYKGPDVFVVLDVPVGERKSWVVWDEGKAPDVVIELLSDSTRDRDKTDKKQIYQNRLRVPEYFWYDPFNPTDFAGFSLRPGGYQPISSTSDGWLISQQLGLALVRWQGRFREVDATWLRWATLTGEVLPTDQERAAAERQRAETEHQRAEAERQRAERLAEKLREMGVDPDQI